jgi:hypothetical protein
VSVNPGEIYQVGMHYFFDPGIGDKYPVLIDKDAEQTLLETRVFLFHRKSFL